MMTSAKISNWTGDEEEILFEITSPGFSTRYPHLINPELITPDAFSVMDHIWTRSRIGPQTLQAHLLKDVYVAGEGIVFNRDLEPFLPSLWPATPDEVTAARAAIESASARHALPHHERCAVLCRKPGNHNYGHWLLEMFPKAVIARQQLGPGLGVVVHSGAPALTPIIDRCLALVGCSDELMIRAGNEPHHHRELVVVSGLTRHGRYMSPLAPGAVSQMAAAIPPGPGQGHRIFVARAKGSKRQIVNQDELIPILERRGFTIVTPGLLGLDEQCQIFSHARVIVGAMGAELTNTVFCAEGTQVLSLVPQGMPDTFFWFLAQHRKLNYTELRSPTPGPLDGRSWNRDFFVNPRDLDAALDKIEAVAA